ncbi:MAG TPA: efflux RND transporter permease subunit [Gammaproteobacteria bacterium]|jgi:multidrug efflux pump subunit AcrB
MMWFVRVALSRPYTFVVMAIMILIFGVLAAISMPTDIFPDIRIPVISVVWTYRGLPPDDMAGRVIYYYERQLSSSVNDIEHIESQSLPGMGIVKIFFQPTVDIRTATAQVTSLSQTVLKQMPPGITPPLILNYNASTVPILQLAMSSNTLPEQKIYDLGQNFIRPALATVRGSAIPSPYGGKARQVQVDLDPQALQSKGLSAQDVETAIAAQNQIIPAGTAKIGKFEYVVHLNDSVENVDEINRFPVKTVNGATVYIGDVAHARDGNRTQDNVVRVNGTRAILMTVLKNGAASTLNIVQGVKDLLPKLEETLPASVKVVTLSDRSQFVKAALSGVIREGVIAAALTCLMILLFIGSWRSTVIIATSIPLAILSSVFLLDAFGQTLNIMTLGGLALAVGILVDDATVTIENINWHLEHGKDVRTAILDGGAQIVTPAFVSLLCICVVFVPMFFLGGIAGYLFKPMAMAVVFAMVSSFCLSRTLVNTMAMYLLRVHAAGHLPAGDAHGLQLHGPARTRFRWHTPFMSFQASFERRFSAVRNLYHDVLRLALEHRRVFLTGFLAATLLSFLLVPFLGRNFFPTVDSGEMAIHVRAQVGTRIEDTAALFDHIEESIRESIPADQLGNIVDNIGLPVSGINRAYSNTGTIGPMDGDIYVALKDGHAPTAEYVKALRSSLPRSFPGTSFAFLPADITSQILNFGNPAPIDINVRGPDKQADQRYALELLRRSRAIPGIADARLQQSTRYPEMRIDIDRTRADRLGITERDVTNSLVAMLAGTFQVAPAMWLKPGNGVKSYPIVAQAPQYKTDTLTSIENLPVTNAQGSSQILGGLGRISWDVADAVASHYDIQPAFDVLATTQGRDLGAVSSDIGSLLKSTAADLPKGATVSVLGQVRTMNSSFTALLLGLLGAIVLIYLIIVVNFQSWLDPFVIVAALPSALAGIVWILFTTGTTLSVPALTGAIMCMGIGTANSILVVSFARERLVHTGDALQAVLQAGLTRFRPVLMTALAMIIGMLPMALGLGEGGEQNAPLGRAVIGGLMFATIATLFLVPTLFYIVHRNDPAAQPGDMHGK